MTDPAARVLEEHFRLAEPATSLTAATDLSGRRGFFRCGSMTLFGRNSRNRTCAAAADELCDLPLTGDELPFDPEEVITNLRLENYLPRLGRDPRSGLRALVRKGYYLLRPLFPVAVRKHMQRRYLAGRLDLPFPSWPVDTTVEALQEELLAAHMTRSGLDAIPFIWFWPEGRRGCVSMTHDVETAAGRDFIPELTALDLRFGFRPAFQFIPEHRYDLPESLRRALIQQGAEINLHGLNHDGRLFDSEPLFRRRAAEINAHGRRLEARGFRSPVLYRNPDWFDRLDFDYEMSMPNVGHLDPQPGGCCTVFPYFIGDMVEIPLTTIQDYSLFHILGDYSLDLWSRQLDIILGRHGLACFNIHPDYVRQPRANAVFRSLLAHLQDRVAADELWAATPGEISTWWRQRAALELRRVDGRWTIRGEGSERARVAQARLTSDGLVLEL